MLIFIDIYVLIVVNMCITFPLIIRMVDVRGTCDFFVEMAGVAYCSVIDLAAILESGHYDTQKNAATQIFDHDHVYHTALESTDTPICILYGRPASTNFKVCIFLTYLLHNLVHIHRYIQHMHIYIYIYI